MSKLTKDMTQGSVVKNLVLFSIPLCLSYFLQALYGSADTLIVGQFAALGDVTGVSQGSQVINILTQAVSGLSSGGTVHIDYNDPSNNRTFYTYWGDNRFTFVVEFDEGIVIEEILPRKNALIRPPMANLDLLFITFAAAHPVPALETVDKLISIAEYNGIEPVIVIGKRDIDPDYAEELRKTYTVAGFSAFALSAGNGDGVAELRAYLKDNLAGKTAAFAGASGVGKSTLLNALFPSLSLQTGEISARIERGKHTTRRVELYGMEGGYIADTPGFSMLDFVRFDFFGREDVVGTMREFEPYIGACRYKKCTHTREEGCAILEAVRAGEIAKSRHESFVSMFDALKNKHDWSKK